MFIFEYHQVLDKEDWFEIVLLKRETSQSLLLTETGAKDVTAR